MDDFTAYDTRRQDRSGLFACQRPRHIRLAIEPLPIEPGAENRQPHAGSSTTARLPGPAQSLPRRNAPAMLLSATRKTPSLMPALLQQRDYTGRSFHANSYLLQGKAEKAVNRFNDPLRIGNIPACFGFRYSRHDIIVPTLTVLEEPREQCSELLW